MHYRKYVVKHLLNKVDSGTTASEFSKSISVLDAITWTKDAMDAITKETVRNCFRKAGFPIMTDCDENFSEDDVQMLYSYEPFITLDDSLQTEDTSMDITDVLAEFQSPEEEDEDDEVVEPVKVITSQEAANYLDLLKTYFHNKDNIENYRLISKMQLNVENTIDSNKKQSTISKFLNKN